MKTLCINIDNGPEWAIAEAEFNRVGISAERFQAVVGDNRPLAFNRSVYLAMVAARGDDLLLFEDDVKFDAPLPPSFIVPGNCMTVHFGANIIGTDLTSWKMPEYYDGRLARLWNCYQSHATLYSRKCVDYILKNFNPNVIDDNNHIFDDWLRTNVLPMGRSFVLTPMIAYQRPRHSDIWNCHADYTGAHIQGNEFLKTLRP